MVSNSTPDFGKYKLIAKIAKGGMADIFLAKQTGLAGFEKLVVIKRILSELAQKKNFIDMFIREARIAALLNHPNVVQIFDFGCIDDQYFIAMEYLSGQSLGGIVRICREKGLTIPLEITARIISKVAEGLHYAHTLSGKDNLPYNIVHRDVSPQNILVIYDGGVKVLDFGIAKTSVQTTQTTTGILKGKYSYMSPEQVLGQHLDNRSDIFSLGILFWECLVGRKLYKQKSELVLLKSIVEQDAPSPTKYRSDIPQQLIHIVNQALSRDLKQRYQTAADMRDDLIAYLKEASAESDSLAISHFMKQLFKSKIKKQKVLIDNALSSSQNIEDLLSDEFFGQSDDKNSVPASSPVNLHPFIVKRQNTVFRKPIFWTSLLVVLSCLSLAIFLYIDQKGIDQPRVTKTVSKAENKPNTPDIRLNNKDSASDKHPITDAKSKVSNPISKIAEEDKVLDTRKKRPRRNRKAKHARNKQQAKLTKEKVVQAPGKLRLFTHPWTNIYYKGKKLGQTPLVDIELPAGTVVLHAVNQEAGIDQKITINIVSGKRIAKRFNLY